MPLEIILAALDSALADAWQVHCGHLANVRIHRGSILELHCDAIVSPANSFGFMDGGIDAAYLRHFGSQIQGRVQSMIRNRHNGELLVGMADLVETGNSEIPCMIVAPTMRVPMILRDSVNPYLACRAALLLVQKAKEIRSMAFPGMGTGVGQVSPNTCAHQMRSAIEDVLLRPPAPPRTWAEASERHQLLYTSTPKRLQQS